MPMFTLNFVASKIRPVGDQNLGRPHQTLKFLVSSLWLSIFMATGVFVLLLLACVMVDFMSAHF